jgi:hypothetical protein
MSGKIKTSIFIVSIALLGLALRNVFVVSSDFSSLSRILPQMTPRKAKVKAEVESSGTESRTTESIKNATVQPIMRTPPPAQTQPDETMVTDEGWQRPDRSLFFDEFEDQKEVAQSLFELGLDAEEPVGDEELVGTNEQGFQQYEFQTDKADVTEWRNADGSTAIAEARYPDGTTMIRTSGENKERPNETTLYYPDGSFKETTYYPSGAVRSLGWGNKDHETHYRYDESGRIVEYYTR